MRGREGQVGTLVDHRITTMSESFLNAAGQRTADLHMQRAESRADACAFDKRADMVYELKNRRSVIYYAYYCFCDTPSEVKTI